MAAFSVEDMVRVESANGPSFSPDGRALSFLSNRSGQPQGYVVDAAGEEVAPPRRAMETEGVVYGCGYRPGRDELLFVADDGGDEQYQLHLVPAAGGDARALASTPRVIHNPGAWSADGRLLSYASNRRDVRFFDVYVLDVDRGEARLVLRQDGMNSAGRFDPAGGALLVSRPNLEHAGDNDLYLVDLADLAGGGGEPRRLTAHDGIARWTHAHVHPGGAVLALSDDGREFTGVQRIDLGSGAREFVVAFDWDVEDLALAPDGARIAIAVNEDGYSRLEVHDLDPDGRPRGRVALPPLPAGVIADLDWRPDGRALAFTLEAAQSPADVWLLDLEAGAPRRVTRSNLHGVLGTAIPEPRRVRYETFDGRRVPAFLYTPERPAHDGPLPCMVLVHGGPEGQSRPALWGRYAAPAYLLATGRCALLVPNVRGSTGYGKEYAHADDVEQRMDSVRDLIAAVDWLAASGAFDAERIGVMGGSYGGFMTLAAITEAPDRWAAAIDLFGIANFVTFLEHTGPWRRKQRAAEYGEDPAFLETISPIHKADRIRTPLLVIQGDHDVRVPPEESEQIVETVRRNEGVVEYVVFEREGHGIQRLPNRLEMARRIVAFLEQYLLAPSPSPATARRRG